MTAVQQIEDLKLEKIVLLETYLHECCIEISKKFLFKIRIIVENTSRNISIISLIITHR